MVEWSTMVEMLAPVMSAFADRSARRPEVAFNANWQYKHEAKCNNYIKNICTTARVELYALKKDLFVSLSGNGNATKKKTQ